MILSWNDSKDMIYKGINDGHVQGTMKGSIWEWSMGTTGTVFGGTAYEGTRLLARWTLQKIL